MIMGGTYETPVISGLLDEDFVEQLRLQGTFNDESFNREYRSIWSGDVENAFFSSEKFDKYGNFIREFVPELYSLPEKWIHQPENMTIDQQKEYGVVIGKDYPFPIVNHKEQRKLALTKYEFSKKSIQEIKKK